MTATQIQLNRDFLSNNDLRPQILFGICGKVYQVVHCAICVRLSGDATQFDSAGLVQHARQCLRMLPAGIGLLGFSCSAKIEKTVINKAAFEFWKILQGDCVQHKSVVVVTFDDAKKLSAAALSFSQKQTDAVNLTIKLVDQTIGFTYAGSVWSVNRILPKPLKSAFTSMAAKATETVLAGLETAIIVYNDEARQPTDYLPAKAGSEAVYTPIELFQHDIPLAVRADSWERFADADLDFDQLECAKAHPDGFVYMSGCTYAETLLTGRATFLDARLGLLADLRRSMQSRCELLGEEIESTEPMSSRSSGLSQYDTPRRILVHLPAEGAASLPAVCDYLFSDETLSDFVERAQEILGVCVPEQLLPPATGLDDPLMLSNDLTEAVLEPFIDPTLVEEEKIEEELLMQEAVEESSAQSADSICKRRLPILMATAVAVVAVVLAIQTIF